MNAPQYQLAIQLPAALLGGRFNLVELEDEIRAIIHGTGRLDTTTQDENEADIFISTNDPQRIFRQLRQHFENLRILDSVQVAYHRADDADYKILWPEPDEADSGGGLMM